MNPEERCQHWDICGLERKKNEGHCILHSSQSKTSGEARLVFQKIFDHLTGKGHTNFQKVIFPQGFEIKAKEFLDVLDLRKTIVENEGILEFKNVTFQKGFLIESQDLGGINILEHCNVVGLVEIECRGRCRQIMFKGSIFHNDLNIKSPDKIEVISIEETEIRGKLNIQAKYISNFRANASTISSILDIQDCMFGGQFDLANTKFSPESEVNLNSSYLRGCGISLAGSSVPPILRINGLIVAGQVIFASPFSHPPMKIFAETKPLQFLASEEQITIKNCDLSECCLLGNNFEKFSLANIQWLHWNPMGLSWFGRDILKDEVHVRKTGNSLKIKNLRESYQILKEQYQRKGNQLQAGYFHYGEMEMRRREEGRRRRYFSLEFLYWLFSGYGLGWGRAVGILIFGTLVASAIYWLDDIYDPGHGWCYWLLHSIQVGTLQRPELVSTGNVSKWTQVIQSIWSPLQIGLFVLAIRMRVRR